jgi:hypothetical protein
MREWSSKSVARDAPGLMGKLRDIIFEELQPHRTQVLAERLKKMKKDEEELRCANNSNKLFQKREKAIREILGDEEWAKIEAQLKEEKKKKRKGKKVPGK